MNKLRMVKDWPTLTIQGEGIYVGQPSIFIRLGGCDLRCTRDHGTGRFFTCDTPESLHEYAHVSHNWRSVSQHAYEIGPNEFAWQLYERWPTIPHLVITGGEPMLQTEALVEFLSAYYSWCTITAESTTTLETNCRRYSELLAEWISHVSLSPKLQVFSEECEGRALDAWMTRTATAGTSVQLKIVCSTVEDFNAAKVVFERALDQNGHCVCVVQPSDQAREDLYAAVLAFGRYRFLPQLHKLMRLA